MCAFSSSASSCCSEQGTYGWHKPVTGPAVFGPSEPFWANGRLERFRFGIHQTGEGDGPRVACRTRACAIDKDAEQPGLERRPALELIEPTQERHPGFLRYVFGCAASHV